MEVVVTTERRFASGIDGKARCTDGSRSYGFWQRYLDVFDRVTVVARQSDATLASGEPVEGPGVSLVALPGYSGPGGYLLNLRPLKQRIREICTGQAAYILRVPSPIGDLARKVLAGRHRPLALEVVGDPYDGFSPGACRHPLRPFFRWSSARTLTRQCRQAVGVAYVTSGALQRRYRPGHKAFTANYSSVELPEAAFASQTRRVARDRQPRTLITVGNLGHLYKAPDLLIDAFAECGRRLRSLKLIVVGDGRYRAELESRAMRKGIGERVEFLGRLHSGGPVRAALDRADLFVLPSHQEGLPRAMIEAMARGLPCIGSTAGGIPELLEPDEMVPPGNATMLANKIEEVMSDRRRTVRLSAENFVKARAYHAEILQRRRSAFYRQVYDVTRAHWNREARVAA